MPTAFKQVADNAISTTLTNLSTTGVTSIALRSGDGAKFPQPGNGFYVTIWNSILSPTNSSLDPYMEKVFVSARSGDILTTAPTANVHTGEVTVALLDVAQNTTDLQTAVNNLENGTPASGSYPYEKTANKGAANGYAPLNSSSAVPVANLPGASTNSYGVVQLAGDLAGTAAAPTVPALANKVNTSTTINGKALSANITLSSTDVGAAATVHTHAESDVTNLTTDLAAKVTKSGDTMTGNLGFPIATKTANYTMVNTDRMILCDTTSGTFAVTLPDATTCQGKQYSIEKIDATNNFVYLLTQSGQVIDAYSEMYINAQSQTVMVVSDGSNWRLLS